MMTGLLKQNDFHNHVASDIPTDHLYLPASSYNTQDTLDGITAWTAQNLMRLNTEKSNYMIWSRNTGEIYLKAFARMSMFTKLKYVGVGQEDLLDVYKLFIRSLLEYCSVAFHSRLTQEDIQDLERVQKTSLKVILGDQYLDYPSALAKCGLESLYSRRESRCLDFALRCVKHPVNSRLFPPTQVPANDLRQTEKFEVNFAKTGTYQKSAIPYCQRLLNKHSRKM